MTLTIHELWSIPRGQIALQDQQMFMHPSTYMSLKHGRTPLWTRYMMGVREAERDRRKFKR